MSNSQATAVMGGSRLKSAKEYKYALTDEARELIWDLRDASRAYGDQPCAQNQKLIDAAVAALRSYIVELTGASSVDMTLIVGLQNNANAFGCEQSDLNHEWLMDTAKELRLHIQGIENQCLDRQNDPVRIQPAWSTNKKNKRGKLKMGVDY